MRIAINGFGRIGRSVLRQIVTDPAHDDIEVALINDIAPLDMLAYLFRYDSTFGPFPGVVGAERGALQVAGRDIPVRQQPRAGHLPLAGVDVFLDCTGKAHSPREAAAGIGAGAANVLISGPCPGAAATVVLGANHDALGEARIVSNASCTTNAIAPVLRLIDDAFGIFHGHVTTVHCYTNSQPLVDGPRDTPARSRAAAVSMIPTTTSATTLTGEVLPHLAGRLSGAALRVPVHSVSCIDAVLTLEEPAGAGLRDWLRTATEASDVLGWTDEQLVSCDLRGRRESLIVSGPETRTTGDHQLRLFGWYDNESGFAARMIDMARRMAAPRLPAVPESPIRPRPRALPR